MIRRSVICWTTLAVAACAMPALYQVLPDDHSVYKSHYEPVRWLLELKEPEIDLAQAKLTIDRMIEPSTDVAALLRRLEIMAAEIRGTFPPDAGSLVKFKALRDYRYQPPAFSGRLRFRYNFEDDRNPRAKLLSVYLSTGKGNCVSMPLLFVILGQKLGIPVTITKAPSHVYVKYRADSGVWYGVEATSGGGWAEDDWQRSQFPNMTQRAIDNGIYMQPLTKKETVAVIAESLLELYEGGKASCRMTPGFRWRS